MTDAERKIKQFVTMMKYDAFSSMLDDLKSRAHAVRSRIGNTLMKNLTDAEIAEDIELMEEYVSDWKSELKQIQLSEARWEADARIFAQEDEEKKRNDNG